MMKITLGIVGLLECSTTSFVHILSPCCCTMCLCICIGAHPVVLLSEMKDLFP